MKRRSQCHRRYLWRRSIINGVGVEGSAEAATAPSMRERDPMSANCRSMKAVHRQEAVILTV